MPTSLRSVGNLLYPPHRREYEDCKQILKLSLTPTHNVKARARLEPAELSEDLPLWASGIRRLSFWLRSASLHSSRTSILFTVNTRSARLNKQRSGDFRLFPPANFANSAILPTDKISAFFMQNFLLQKPKDSSWSMPLLSPQGKNDRLRYRSAEWTVSTPWSARLT